MKSILVTGGAGFIGSNFIPFFLEKYPHYKIINLDKLTYAGNQENLTSVMANPRHIFVKGDICNRELINYLFHTHNISGIIHFAAESHVDNSISRPNVFIKSNITGTFTLLEVAKEYWMEEPFVPREGYEKSRFHHISTDEVYGTLGKTGLFKETTPYAPNSPYSASKASSDMIVRSYFHTYGLNTVITNCSNNYGPKQHDEKLIPVVIRKALQGEKIPIYGDGNNVRDWLYVLDHCKGIDLVYHKGREGEVYNIGGNNEMSNNSMVMKICNILDELHPANCSYQEQIAYVKDRPGHDRRYAVDTTKIMTELEWKIDDSFDAKIRRTIEWYLLKYLHENTEEKKAES